MQIRQKTHSTQLISEQRESGYSEQNTCFTVKEVKGGRYDVSAVSISDLIAEYKLPRIDILKMDIEGSEYEVFDKSCLKWLDKVEMVITEIHDDIREGCSARVLKYMKEKGFGCERRSEMWIFTRSTRK